jgi:hypothetical protein
MALTTNGLTNGGVSTHYRFQYDDSLAAPLNPGGPEPARTNAMIAACESDFNLMSGWFGNINLDVNFPISVNVIPPGQPGACTNPGACWGLSSGNLSVTISDSNLNTIGANIVRYLIVSEMVEQFMRVQQRVLQAQNPQNLGWFGSGTEGSAGEGLSRFLAAQFLAINGLGGTPAGYTNSNIWLSSARADFVNNVRGNDDGPDNVTGCSLLFIYYLFSQLTFGINAIVAAGANNLGGVYRNLSGDNADPFPFFKQLLDSFFPGTTAIPGTYPNPDNPFPLIPFKQGTGSSFCVSTAPGEVEVFWIRSDGMVFTNGRIPNFNQGNWNNPINNIAPAPGSADPRSGVTAVSTAPGAVEVFWIRSDGMVFTNGRIPNFNQGNWNNPINNVAPASGSADPRSGVAAVSTAPGAVEVFWIRSDGMVFTNGRIPNLNQGNWNNPINNVAPAPGSADPRSGVAAVSTEPGAVEVFWIRHDGMVFTNGRIPNFNQGNWNNPILIGSGADPRSGVAAVSRQFRSVDVFWVSAQGEIMTSTRNPFNNNGQFTSPVSIAPPSSAYSSSPVGAVCSSLNAVEVFWIRSDGMVFTNGRIPNFNQGNWNNPINNVAPLRGSAATPQR